MTSSNKLSRIRLPNVVSVETIRASEELNRHHRPDEAAVPGSARLRDCRKLIPVITRFIEWVKAVAVPTFKRDFQPAIVSLSSGVPSPGLTQGLARVIPVITSVH